MISPPKFVISPPKSVTLWTFGFGIFGLLYRFGLLDFWILGLLDSFGLLDFGTFGQFWTFGFLDFWTLGQFWIFGFLDSFLLLDFWNFGQFWIFGLLDFWTFGQFLVPNPTPGAGSIPGGICRRGLEKYIAQPSQASQLALGLALYSLWRMSVHVSQLAFLNGVK